MKPSLFFFDVDHTITDGSTGRRFAETAARRGVLKLRHLAMIPISYALYRLGGGGIAFFEGQFPVLRGVEKTLFEELGRDVFERRTRKALRPEMRKLIESIKADGGEVILATSSLDFIVRPLADLLGIDILLASELEYKDGRCTGTLAGKALFGHAKRDAVLSYARGRGVALADCAFYSDSIHDLPLLLEVGKPVAVAPDRRLRREAEARGWSILEPR
jgi:HAD superfamily hydrolase (TIGR01490 family)